MFERFRNVAKAVASRNKVIRAFTSSPRSSPLGLVLNDPPGGRSVATGSSSTMDPVSMESLTKLQGDYSQLLAKLDRATDRLAPAGNQRHSLWASLGVEDYFRLLFRAYDLYKRLVPYWDQTLIVNFEWHWNHRTVRTKTLNRIAGRSNLRNYAKDLKGQRASVFLALLQEELDDNFDDSNRPALLSLLLELSDNSDELASTLWLTGVKRRAKRAYGGEAEVWVGSHNQQEVAVRDFWFPSEISPKRLRKILRREIINHRQLNHPNVLRLRGVFQEEGQPMSVVSPWMANGTAMNYLEYHPVELLHLLQGAAEGLRYLHSLNPPVIHGDIHPRNILVNADGDAVLRDLGTARVRLELASANCEECESAGPASAGTSNDAKSRPKNPLAALFDPMTAHYHPPELHPPHLSSPANTPAVTYQGLPYTEGDSSLGHGANVGPSTSTLRPPSPILTFSTDCYSLAMTFYELITSLRPFHHLIHDATALGNSSTTRRSHSPSRSRQTLHQTQTAAQQPQTQGSGTQMQQSWVDPKAAGMAILAAIQAGARPSRPITRASPVSAVTMLTSTGTFTTTTTSTTTPFYPPSSIGSSLPSINRTTSAPPLASSIASTSTSASNSTATYATPSPFPTAAPSRSGTAIPIRGNISDAHFQSLWSLLERMWAPDASSRPSMSEVCMMLGGLENRLPCRGCFDMHRGKECVRESDDGECAGCRSIAIECIAMSESDVDLGRGYGLDTGRAPAPNGYYINEMELPPSPDGLTPLQLVEEPRRVRLVPFTWAPRRRQPSSQA